MFTSNEGNLRKRQSVLDTRPESKRVLHFFVFSF